MSDFCRYNPTGSKRCTYMNRAWKPCPLLDEYCTDNCPLEAMADKINDDNDERE